MEKVSIIIATYNGKKFLEKCIPSVLNSRYEDFEIIICDDSSDDGSYELLSSYQDQHHQIKVIRNISNMGAAKTRNIAVQHANGSILIFLDNDTQVDQNWIEEICRPFNDNTIGAVQATLVEYDKRDTIQLIGTKLIPHTCWGIPLLKGENINNRPKSYTEIIALSAAMAIRKTVFVQVRGFDEKLAIQTEDLDFSLRIWIAGHKIVNAPNAIVYHLLKKVSERIAMKATTHKLYFHFAKNSLRTITKNYGIRMLIKYLPMTVLILVGRSMYRLVFKDITAVTGTLQGFIWYMSNIRDTLANRRIVQREIRKVSDSQIEKTIFSQESLIKIFQKYFS